MRRHRGRCGVGRGSGCRIACYDPAVLRSRVAVVIALVAAGWVLPGLCGMTAALHLVDGHDHAALQSADALESLLHGHFHDSATPEHTHALWLTSAAPRPPRVDTIAANPTVDEGPLARPRPGPGSAQRCDESGKRATSVPLPVLHCALLS
jgi:hypothetical protein